MRNSSGTLLGSWTWNNVNIGAGGFVTRICFSTDGQTKVTRGDVGAAYVWGPSDTKWRQAFKPYPDGLPADGTTDNGTSFASRTFEICVAPSDHNRIYGFFNSRLYKSTDCGVSWTHLTGFPDGVSLPCNNGPQPHNCGPTGAVSPSDPNTFMFGTPGNGLFVSTDGGATITNITSLPANVLANGWTWPNKVATDGTNWYIVVQGTGIYTATSPLGPYSAMTMTGATSKIFTDLKIDGAGNVWACEYTGAEGGPVWKCASGTWAIANSSSYCVVAIKYVDATHYYVHVMSSDGFQDWSTDGGTTWHGAVTGSSNGHRNMYPTTVPWLGWGDSTMFKPGCIEFDPSASNDLWATSGIGVYKCNPPQTLTPTAGNWFNWFEVSEGNEEMVAWDAMAIPGGKRIFLCQDRPIWTWDGSEKFPRGPFVPGKGTVTGAHQLTFGRGADYADNDPTWVAALVDENGYYCGVSTDGGKSWSPFANPPPLTNLGGNIAVGNKNNVVIVQGNNALPLVTTDCVNWSVMTGLPGVPATGSVSSLFRSQGTNRQILVRDKTGGYFYIYSDIPSHQGVYRSVDGVTWTQQYSGQLSIYDGFAARLEVVTGKSGHLFFTTGISTNNEPRMFFSQDAGVTWTNVTSATGNLTSVQTIGIGKAAPGASYPAIYAYGNNNLVQGLWACFDFNPSTASGTWTNLTVYPNDNMGFVYCVMGDPDKFGRIYVGIANAGFCYADYDYELAMAA